MDIEKLEELEKLNELREKGIITEEEYNKIRDKTLSLFVKEHKVKNINKRKSLWEYYSSCVNEKYKTISGRASRKEYIGFNLFWCIFYPTTFFLIFFITNIICSVFSFNLSMLIAITPIVLLFRPFILPSICVHIRRLHDMGYSGVFWVHLNFWEYVIGLCAFTFNVDVTPVATILFIIHGWIVMHCIFVKGDDEINEYGLVSE